MNIQITFDPIEMLKNMDRKLIFDYIRNTITEQDRIEISNTLYTADSDTLWEALEIKIEEECKDLSIFVESRVENSELLKRIDREDGAQITEYESVKGGISSAFKRAAASGWGVGRYLYDLRNQWFPIKQRGKGYEFAVTPKISTEDKGSTPTEDSNAVKESHQDKL